MSTSAGILNVIIGASISDFLTKMQIADRQMSKSAKNTGKAAAAIKTAMIGALTGTAMASVNMAIEFDRSLTKMRTLAGATAKDIDEFKKSIMRLAGETGRAPQELADALYFITSSGLEGAEALKALEASAQAAAIGMGDTQVIADALTSVLNAYGHEAYTASEATNILLRSVKLGKAEADELAGSIGQVVPTAAQLGLKFEDLGAAISAITLTGKNASEAVTGVNSVLMALMTTSSEGAKRLQSVGLSFEDLRRELRQNGLAAMLGLINKHFGDNVEAISDILGRKEAISSYFSLVGEGADNYAKALAMAATATDELKISTEIFEDSAAARQEKMMARLAAATTKWGNALVWVLLKLQDLGTESSNSADKIHKKYLRALEAGKKGVKDFSGPNVMGNPWESDIKNEMTSRLIATAPKVTFNKKSTKTKTEEEYNKMIKEQIALMERLTDLMDHKYGRSQKQNDELAKKMTGSMEEFNDQLRYSFKNGKEFVGAWENAGVTLREFFSKLLTDIETVAGKIQQKFGTMFDFMRQSVSDLQSVFADSHQNRMNDITAQELRELEAYKAKYEGAAGYEEGLTALQAEQLERRSKAQSDYAQDAKKMAKFQAILAGALAQLQIWADPTLHWAVKAGMAIVVGATTAAQMAVIDGATLPSFVSGGIMPHSGTALVGERGPELVSMPMSSKVTPNHLLGGGDMRAALDREQFILWSSQGGRNHRFRRAGLA